MIRITIIVALFVSYFSLNAQESKLAGIGLGQIFRALTFNNSKIFNLSDLYGSVEKGKIANLLILKDNPLNNIDAYNKVESVIIRGNIISRNDLSAENN